MGEISNINQGNRTVTAKVTFDKYMELLREAESKQMSLNQLFLTKLFPVTNKNQQSDNDYLNEKIRFYEGLLSDSMFTPEQKELFRLKVEAYRELLE